MSFRKMLMLVILVSLQAYVALTERVSLTIADGAIQGQVSETIGSKLTYYNFRGIPYAKPPVGNLRFSNPEKNSPWNGTLDATYDGSQCIQYASGDIAGSTIYGKEDCLFINVYTPNYNTTGLPVLVYIHGGSFLSGNSSYESFAPDFFLEENLVFVSFNYRLGIFGFLSTEDKACPGNWGIKDQILALKWVQENIAYFGGDPGKVTIFGQSTGAASVHLLMQTTKTNGLFARAIMNSGSTLNLWGLNTRASETASLVARDLGIFTTNTAQLVENLRNINAEQLQRTSWLAAWGLFLNGPFSGLPYAPTMERDIHGAVYVNPSDDALNAGKFAKVPVLMGFNSNEGVATRGIPSLIRTVLLHHDVALRKLVPYSLTANAFIRNLAGSNIKRRYFQFDSIVSDLAKVAEFISADQFNRPIRRAATDMANHTTVYFYEFGYEGTIGNHDRTFEGVGHGEDLVYLFRSINGNYTSTDIKVSKTLVTLWSNFAKYGNPTPEKDQSLNNVIWNPVDAFSPNLKYLDIKESISQAVNPKQRDWEYYIRIWDTYGDKTETTTY